MSLNLLDILCILLVLSGLGFFLGASVGLLRFPDFYTRMHAAGKGDTLSTLLIMSGAGVYELHHFDPAGSAISVILIVIKILAIGVFIMLTSPTSTHALMKAGYEDNIEPVGEGGEMQLRMPELGYGSQALPKVAAAPSPPSQEAAPAPVPPTKKTPRRKVAKKVAKKAAKKVAAKKAAKKKAKAKKKVAVKKTTAKKKVPPRKED